MGDLIVKRVVFLFLAIFILAYIVYASIGTVTLDNLANQTNSTTGNITFQCNATANATTSITNVTFFLWNESETYTSVNVSSNTSAGALGGTVVANFTENLTETNGGYNYTWGCLVTNNVSETKWASTNNTFKVDLFVPTVTSISPADSSTDFDGTVNFTYNVSDNASSIGNCSLIIDSAVDQTDTSITKDTGQSFVNSSIISSNALSWYVSCYDQVGRQANSTARTLDTFEDSTSSGGGGGGGYSGTDYKGGDINSLDVTRTYRAKDTLSFTTPDGESHQVKIKTIRATEVVIEVSSSHLVLKTISVGQTENIDVDSDGDFDLSVTLNSININKADLTFKKYGQTVLTQKCYESWTCTEWSSCSNKGTRTRTCTDSNNCGTTSIIPIESESCTPIVAEDTGRSSPAVASYIWWVIGVAVLALVFFTIKKKKTKSSSGRVGRSR